MTETLQVSEETSARKNTEILLAETSEHITTLTLNDPASRNALSEAMMAALWGAISEVAECRATRAVILAANGPVFCAGHNLKEMTVRRRDDDRGRAYFTEIMSQCSALMRSIVACPKPVIAAVHGPATAAGCQLVASCDLAVASAKATFCTPGVDIGLFCSTPMVALSRNVSRKHAMEMLLTGEMIGASKAAEIGLVNRVVPDGEEIPEARALARLIASKSPAVVAIGKEAFYRQAEKPLADAYDDASEVMVRNMLHGDAEEGIGAFLEKREPRWKDT